MDKGKPLVVLDTNALVAARFRPAGAAALLVKECIKGDIQPLISEAIERENRSIIMKVRPPEDFLDRLDRFYAAAIRLEPDLRLTVAEDPADNRYLECAVAGGAGYIVTSDRHLLVHDGFRGIRICKAGRLLEDLDAASSKALRRSAPLSGAASGGTTSMSASSCSTPSATPSTTPGRSP